MRLLRFRTALLALPFLFAACDTDPVDECEDRGDCIDPVEAAVYVGNQGNFADNNGSITHFDPATGAVEQNVVPDLGGLVQHITVSGDRAYVLLNFDDSFSTGRGRIDVVDLDTHQRTAQITVKTPRTLAIGAGAGWVSNLYENTVTPLDLSTNTAGTPIPVGQNPEGVLVTTGSRVFVANFGFGFSTTVSEIAPATRTVARTLEVGCDGPRSLGEDGEGELWVFCTGKTVYDADFNVIERTNGAAVVLDPATGAERARIALDGQIATASFGQDVAFPSRSLEAWVVLDAGRIARFNTTTNTLVATATPDLPATHLVGAIAYDQVSERLYVTTVPPDFVSAGSVVVLDRAGTRVASFAAGLIPSAVAFRDAVVIVE